MYVSEWAAPLTWGAGVADLGAPASQGEAMVAELRWVHDMIRRDLGTVRQMAADAGAGQPASAIRAALRSLATASPLWQLKINCLQYCRFVHSHHTAESIMLFPELRRANPALDPVVDKLEADHVHVSGLLDEVEAAARDLGGTDAASTDVGSTDVGSTDVAGTEPPDGRERLIQALHTLSTDLLAHLEYEEEQISGTLRTWTSWPGW